MKSLFKKANRIRKQNGYTSLIRRTLGYGYRTTIARWSVLVNPVTVDLTSNRTAQQFLERVVLDLEYLLGVGSGDKVQWSGEEQLINKVASTTDQPTVIDVGAHKGEFTDLVLANTDEAIIHQFEPQQSCIEILNEKYDESISINGYALSNEKGDATIYYPIEGGGRGSLTKRKYKHSDSSIAGQEQTKCNTLENYINENNIDEIDLLKLDVEGHELKVLRGGEELFEEQRVKICSFEFGGACIDTRTYLIDYYEFFEQYNYEIYRLTPGGHLYELQEYREFNERFRTSVLVAIPSGSKFMT